MASVSTLPLPLIKQFAKRRAVSVCQAREVLNARLFLLVREGVTLPQRQTNLHDIRLAGAQRFPVFAQPIHAEFAAAKQFGQADPFAGIDGCDSIRVEASGLQDAACPVEIALGHVKLRQLGKALVADSGCDMAARRIVNEQPWRCEGGLQRLHLGGGRQGFAEFLVARHHDRA